MEDITIRLKICMCLNLYVIGGYLLLQTLPLRIMIYVNMLYKIIIIYQSSYVINPLIFITRKVERPTYFISIYNRSGERGSEYANVFV